MTERLSDKISQIPINLTEEEKDIRRVKIEVEFFDGHILSQEISKPIIQKKED